MIVSVFVLLRANSCFRPLSRHTHTHTSNVKCISNLFLSYRGFRVSFNSQKSHTRERSLNRLLLRREPRSRSWWKVPPPDSPTSGSLLITDNACRRVTFCKMPRSFARLGICIADRSPLKIAKWCNPSLRARKKPPNITRFLITGFSGVSTLQIIIILSTTRENCRGWATALPRKRFLMFPDLSLRWIRRGYFPFLFLREILL